MVLVGDAFATSCPAAGTGCNKVFTDVERLCNVHIPAWLASAGMGADKIAAFYADADKRACDAHSTAKAYRLRALSTDEGFSWRARPASSARRAWARCGRRASGFPCGRSSGRGRRRAAGPGRERDFAAGAEVYSRLAHYPIANLNPWRSLSLF